MWNKVNNLIEANFILYNCLSILLVRLQAYVYLLYKSGGGKPPLKLYDKNNLAQVTRCR
jgi:hypothetical protein